MSASTRGPDHTIVPSSMNAMSSATVNTFSRVLLDEQHRAAPVAELDDRLA